MDMDAAAAARFLLMYFVVPLWLAAGVADYLCHRRSGIQHSAGVTESLIHLLMLAETAVPVLAPYGEELWRCSKARRAQQASRLQH